MNRDLNKQIEQGDSIITKHNRLDLYGEDLHLLLDNVMVTRDANQILEAVVKAYKAGIAVGARYGRRQRAKA